jgi:hypothetical protein
VSVRAALSALQLGLGVACSEQQQPHVAALNHALLLNYAVTQNHSQLCTCISLHGCYSTLQHFIAALLSLPHSPVRALPQVCACAQWACPAHDSRPPAGCT